MLANRPWSHLPNAAHIDRILASIKTNPQVWDEVRDEVWLEVRREAWDEVRREAWNEARDEVWREARGEAWNEAPAGAILALLAWPNSAHLLNADPEHVRMLAALGHKPAILLLPAAVAFASLKNTVVY